MTSGEKMLGKIVPNSTRDSVAPIEISFSTYSILRTFKVEEYAIRVKCGVYKMATTTVRFCTPAPHKPTTIMASKIGGKQRTTSTARIIAPPTLPPI